MAEMTNIDIRDFQTVSGVGENDYVVLSLSGGGSAKMAVGMFTSSVSSNAKPSIKEGVWWIGTVNTEVKAEGKTPEMRRGELGVEYKYTSEDESAWRLLVPYEDIRLNFDELTETQRDQLRLKFSDLTEEEIAELQKPASDMIAVLEQTNADAKIAEEMRAGEFASLKAESVAATAEARDAASHPTYIGKDHYVYIWNKTAQTYDKTDVYVKGDAFTIKKVYQSVDEMYADTETSFREGEFCLINTGSVDDPENAQLYVRNADGGWDFMVDMSGAVGFTGKTPQLFIGEVSVGSGKDSAAVTLTSTGTDTDGNPKYNINYVIPCLTYEDFTEEQIAELQRPANDMIAQLQATDNSVKEAETLRVTAEEDREEEFSRLKSEGETATSGANTAAQTANEAAGNANEAARAADESAARAETSATTADTAAQSAQTAASVADAAADAANAAAVEARNVPKIQDGTWWVWDSDAGSYKDTGAIATGRSPLIQNGTWWTWDDSLGQYVDSGQSISSEYQLTKEKIEGVFTGDIVTHTHTHLIYHAQTYTEQPDFSTLTSWTGDDGLVHDFLPGNDIYVADGDEPTGYANYKLAISTSGNVWVRIPQVPEGYRMVLELKD